VNGSTILAGLFAAAGLTLTVYAWAPRPDPRSPDAARFPDATPYDFKYEGVTPALRAAARAGDLDAQFELGVLLILDAGADTAPPEAVEWLLTAAEAGHPAAANEIGNGYAKGDLGLPRDPDAAFQWHRRAAAGGDELGQFNVAIAYRDGAGVRRDDAQAARYFLLSAERGVPYAQFNLALVLREGVGLKRSRETARRAKAAAARQGYGKEKFLTWELRTVSGVALSYGPPEDDHGHRPGFRLSGPFADPGQEIRCRAIFEATSGIDSRDSSVEVTTEEKQLALMRVAALLGDPYAQTALANYWKGRPQEPNATNEEYYWRMRAARNPLKLEIPADCGVKG
jgi:hypothetical protein